MSGKKYPTEQRERALRMALDRLADYSTPYACAKALAPKLGWGRDVAHVDRAGQVDEGGGSGPTSVEREEIKRLRAQVRDLREANEVGKAATVFFVRELDPRTG